MISRWQNKQDLIMNCICKMRNCEEIKMTPQVLGLSTWVDGGIVGER